MIMKTITKRFTSSSQGQRFTVLCAATAACLITGCSDPADSVPKSAATAAQATNQPAMAAKDFVIRAESKIGFVGSKVTGSHDGGFKKFAGKVSVADGKVTATAVKIAMDSTWSDSDRLTGHLKSADFFDAAKFPFATFTLTGIVQTNVTGNLDLHGVTKSISFPADIQIADDAVTVKSEFAINRKDFSINYPGKTDDLIRDNVVLKLDLKATPGEPRPEDQLPN